MSGLGKALDSHATNPGSIPRENILFVQALPVFYPGVTILGNHMRVHLIPYLRGVSYKKESLSLKRMTGFRLLRHYYHHPPLVCRAINKPPRDVRQNFNQSNCARTQHYMF